MDIDGDRVSAVMEELWRQLIDSAPERVWRRMSHGVVAFVSGIAASSMNGAYAFRHDIDVDEVGRSLTEVAKAGVPFCIQARPSLRDVLAGTAGQFGLVPDEDVPLMVLDDLATLRSAAQIDGLRVRRLADDEQAVHEDVLSAGFGMPQAMARQIMQFVQTAPGLSMYVGEVEDAPVTTAVTVSSADGSVGVFNVATPPEHRKHGYGAAVTAAAVLDSLGRDASWAWLQSSSDGYRVYQGLGFRVAEAWPAWVTAPDS